MKNGTLFYDYDSKKDTNKIASIFELLNEEGILYKDIQTKESSLEDIFVELVTK